MSHDDLTSAPLARSAPLLARASARDVRLPPRYQLQMAHLTAPATVAKYVEAACTRSDADLVMLDLEDSIPRGDDALLAVGRDTIVRAFLELDWGRRLRFFRPRGLELDPGHTDVIDVVSRAGARVEGVVYPKAESADEIASLDATLTALEERLGLPPRQIRIEVLIESVSAEEQAFEIARASPRLAGLVFGAYDYWSSLRVVGERYRTDHPLVDQARGRIARAAASVGVAAIAEMTLNYPTRDKSPAEREAALAECRRDAEHARAFGFRGKWTGIPAQAPIVREVFALPDAVIDAAIAAARAFLEAERGGRGATMIDGKMSDRATDRVHRVALETAFALGRLDAETARELGLGERA